MTNSRDGGKGDRPRPIPNWDHYATNWDRIFQQAKELKKNIKQVNEEFDKAYNEWKGKNES